MSYKFLCTIFVVVLFFSFIAEFYVCSLPLTSNVILSPTWTTSQEKTLIAYWKTAPWSTFPFFSFFKLNNILSKVFTDLLAINPSKKTTSEK